MVVSKIYVGGGEIEIPLNRRHHRFVHEISNNITGRNKKKITKTERSQDFENPLFLQGYEEKTCSVSYVRKLAQRKYRPRFWNVVNLRKKIA